MIWVGEFYSSVGRKLDLVGLQLHLKWADSPTRVLDLKYGPTSLLGLVRPNFSGLSPHKQAHSSSNICSSSPSVFALRFDDPSVSAGIFGSSETSAH